MTKERSFSHEPGKTTEIERKFIVLPDILEGFVEQHGDLDQYPHSRIAQGYLTNSPQGAVRVRQKGDKYFLTFKAPSVSHPAERVELETEITREQFDTMWPGTEGRRLEKTRYEIPAYDGIHTIELDVFGGDLAGHALAEVEFSSTQEADSFTPPILLNDEVTENLTYGNASIAENGFPLHRLDF